MIVYLARDIPPFVMYCINGKPRSSLLIESTDYDKGEWLVDIEWEEFISLCRGVRVSVKEKVGGLKMDLILNLTSFNKSLMNTENNMGNKLQPTGSDLIYINQIRFLRL